MFSLCRYMPFGNEFCCACAPCWLCFDAIRNTNWNNSFPLKKVEQNDFGRQNEMEQESEKTKLKMSETRRILVIWNALLGIDVLILIWRKKRGLILTQPPTPLSCCFQNNSETVKAEIRTFWHFAAFSNLLLKTFC